MVLRMVPVAVLVLAGGLLSAPGVGVAGAAADEPTHVVSTWDAPDKRATVWDHGAVSAEASADTVLTPTDNAVCDLYTTTYTLRWQALGGHRLTAVATESDDFGYGWRRLDSTTWQMTPDGLVYDEKSPLALHWYLKGTHRQDASRCPRDSRTVNHVEIFADGAPVPGEPDSFVDAPSRPHLALAWDWPDDVTTYRTQRATADLSAYHEVAQPEGPCEAHITELDLHVTAVPPARIIAVGTRAPGEPMRYQRGDAPSYSLGIVAYEWFLTGTTTRSDTCPPDTLSQDRVEVYTDTKR